MQDPSKITINLNGEFSAEELDDIIRELAVARSGMQPAVPQSPPSETSDAEVLDEREASFAIRTLTSGGIRFWLRSSGLGWQAFAIDATKALEIREFLNSKLGHSHTFQ